MENIAKKAAIAASTVVLGITLGLVLAQVHEKRKEKRLGGKLMRVNYRFTKDYDD